MTTKNPKLHDTTLAIRLPKALHDQLETLATSQYMKVSELVRQLVKEEIKRAQPYIGTNIQPQQKPKSNSIYEAMSPAERKSYEDEWDY